MLVLLCLCAGEQYSAASLDAVSDDAMFRDKLKHMGKCESNNHATPASAMTLLLLLLINTSGLSFYWYKMSFKSSNGDDF